MNLLENQPHFPSFSSSQTFRQDAQIYQKFRDFNIYIYFSHASGYILQYTHTQTNTYIHIHTYTQYKN